MCDLLIGSSLIKQERPRFGCVLHGGGLGRGGGLVGLVQLHGRRPEGRIPLRQEVAPQEEAPGEMMDILMLF